MCRKYIKNLILILIILSSCCSQKEFLSIEKPIIYKLVKQQSFYHTSKKISFWKEEWTKHIKAIDSTHFIYQNFKTFYVFSPNKTVKKLELRNISEEDVILNHKNKDGIIGKFNDCSIKLNNEKQILEKRNLDTIIIRDQIQNIESILIRINNN